MAIDPALIERIYEAAALPDLWPNVLQAVADAVQAFGVSLSQVTGNSMNCVASPPMERLLADYMADGWLARDTRTVPIATEQYPGFRVDSDFWSEEEQRAIPLYRDFLLPRGLMASGATCLQGPHDDALFVAVEGLPSFSSAASAVPILDAFRPHLGRASSLSARLRQARLDASVEALQLAGVGAAVVSGDGRLRAANDRFTQRLGNRMFDRPTGLRFADRFLQAQFAEALATVATDASSRSIGVAATDDHAAFAIHLLPLRRAARDVFGWDGVLLLLAEAANASVPGADLLRLLFDLTPAEARLTRLLLEGRTPAEAAALLRITDATIRVHLKRVFAKTGVRRHAELVRLLLGVGAGD